MTTPIKRIFLVFKTHLDIGFTDLSERVLHTYMNRFIPGAIRFAKETRERGDDPRFVWTCGAWLIHRYLEGVSGSALDTAENAIKQGDLTWHAMPFTPHSELMPEPLFRHGLSFSGRLDKRFRIRTVAAKLTDVPGHTLGIAECLYESGVRFLHIGSNPGSRPPDLPKCFRWGSKEDRSLMVIYNKGAYGGLVRFPGSGDGLALFHTEDNDGPVTPEKFRSVVAELRRKYPWARIVGSGLNEYADAVMADPPDLPWIHGEMGDTWIHGVQSDPTKIRHFKTLWREREFLNSTVPSLEMDRFMEHLTLVCEHTWGMDVKTHLNDKINWGKSSFHRVRSEPNFKKMIRSWKEQRRYLAEAVNAFSDSRTRTHLRKRLRESDPVRSDLTGWSPVDRKTLIRSRHFEIGLSMDDGVVNYLADRESGWNFASDRHRIGQYLYQIFTEKDYDRFLKQYCYQREIPWWFPLDFGKPGCGRATGRIKQTEFLPIPVGTFLKEDDLGLNILVRFKTDHKSHHRFGNPRLLDLYYCFPSFRKSFAIDLMWFDKDENRIAESCWLGFRFRLPKGARFSMYKMGIPIAAEDVIRNGNRKLHAAESFSWTWREADTLRTLTVKPIDGALLAPGRRSLLDFNNRLEKSEQGVWFNLYNNVWGTNFPMWFGEDARFRFEVAFP